jgi:glutamate/tyrosine decarboxylase-like PLP-dependent enzyme
MKSRDEGIDDDDDHYFPPTEKTEIHPNDSKQHDSLEHYFIPTTRSEELLDDYINHLISSFLHSNGSINAYEQVLQTPSVDSTEISSYFISIKETLLQSTRTNAPQMLGHMTSALPYFHRPLARLLTSLNQNVVKVETAGTLTRLERVTIEMLHSCFFGYKKEFYEGFRDEDVTMGMICSGGTIANITALWVARNKCLPTVSQIGMTKALQQGGWKNAVIIGSKMMHYSFRKAVDLLGLGEESLIKVDVDEQFCVK